jgi:hypothetical protein
VLADAAGAVIERVGVAVDEVGVRLSRQGRADGLEVVGEQEVVGVQEADRLRACPSDGGVARGGDPAVGLCDHAHPRVGEATGHLARPILGAIVDDHDLEV